MSATEVLRAVCNVLLGYSLARLMDQFHRWRERRRRRGNPAFFIGDRIPSLEDRVALRNYSRPESVQAVVIGIAKDGLRAGEFVTVELPPLKEPPP